MRRIIFVTIAIAAIAAAIFYVDFATLWSAVAGLSTVTLVMLFLLLSAGAAVKALRWAFYLHAAGLHISQRDAMTSYLAGMSAAAVPGGSWLAPRLAQEHGEVRMRQAAVGLFVGFVADALALALVAIVAITLMDEPNNRYAIPALAIGFAGLLIAMGKSERLWYFIDRFLARWRLTQSWLPKEADIHGKVRAVMRVPVIARGVGFSIAATLVSMLVLYVLTNALTIRGVSLDEALYVHGFSEAAAMVIPSPGGIGVIDSSMAGLLNSLSIGWVRATYIVLTIRSIDLLYKTVVGSMVLVAFYHGLLASILRLRHRSRTARRHAWLFASRRARRLGLNRTERRARAGGKPARVPPSAGLKIERPASSLGRTVSSAGSDGGPGTMS
jgi:uncharacterized membrane protein YbhN (UPF0104 family)